MVSHLLDIRILIHFLLLFALGSFKTLLLLLLLSSDDSLFRDHGSYSIFFFRSSSVRVRSFLFSRMLVCSWTHMRRCRWAGAGVERRVGGGRCSSLHSVLHSLLRMLVCSWTHMRPCRWAHETWLFALLRACYVQGYKCSVSWAHASLSMGP